MSNKRVQSMHQIIIWARNNSTKGENNKKNPENHDKLQYKSKWIFHHDGSIESGDIDRNKCLLCEQRLEHIVRTSLWPNMFFFNQY